MTPGIDVQALAGAAVIFGVGKSAAKFSTAVKKGSGEGVRVGSPMQNDIEAGKS